MLSLFAKLKNKYFREFIQAWGREPKTPKEWMTIQDNAVRELNKTKGVPPGPKKPPFQGWKPEVIQGGKGIESLLESGAVKKGVAPKTTKETLKAKKDRGILLRDADEDIARIKRENKQAIKDFKKKFHKKKTVEDFRDEGDWDPGGMASGGRIGYAAGTLVKGGKWFLKSLNDTKEKIKLLDITLSEKKQYLDQIEDQIRRINAGEPIPDEVIQTIRKDPKFKSVWQNQKSSDPDLAEMEEVVLEYGKRHAEGGRASLMYGGDPGFAFEYGGSWADWHDQHRDQMPVEQYIKTKLPKHRLPFREMNEGGIARLGYAFGGKALKAIMDAWRANKTWGVRGPPYKPEATSFDVKKMTKKHLGTELSLNDLRNLEKSPWMERGGQTFDQFNQEFKIIKARVLKEKLEESKAQAEAMIDSAKVVPADNPTAKKVQAQFTRDGKKQLEESIEGLKEIDIYIGMLQKKGRSVHQSGGLAYMLGEPTYMKYSAGGSVGHAPWHKPTGQQQPQGQLDTPAPQVGGAQSPGSGQPNPMKAPRGLPSVAPKTMDPQYMQQQMMQRAMQRAMMGQASQQPRMGMEEGGMIPEQFLEDLKRKEYHEFLDNYHRWKENYERRKDLGVTQEAAGGGRIGFGLGSMSRRAFMKMMAGMTALPFIGKGVSKVAPKAIKEVTETITRDSAGIPSYAFDLIEVVKAKGVQEVIEGVTRKVPATKYSYKGVDVTVHPNGLTEVRKTHTGPATWTDETGDVLNDEAIHREVGFDIHEGGYEQIGNPQFDDAAKSVKVDDEYFEATVRPDRDGKMKDMEEFIEEADHLDLKKIADEATTEFEKFSKIRNKKASGGLAHMLGE